MLATILYMDRKYIQAASAFRALGNPTRITILELLRDGEISREELFRRTKVEAPAFAQHLSRLRQSGLVSMRREGKEMYYRISDPGVLELCDRASVVYKRI